jgi:hypothetical protein
MLLFSILDNINAKLQFDNKMIGNIDNQIGKFYGQLAGKMAI